MLIDILGSTSYNSTHFPIFIYRPYDILKQKEPFEHQLIANGTLDFSCKVYHIWMKSSVLHEMSMQCNQLKNHKQEYDHEQYRNRTIIVNNTCYMGKESPRAKLIKALTPTLKFSLRFELLSKFCPFQCLAIIKTSYENDIIPSSMLPILIF